jgi:hypothetical protein
LAPFSSKRSQRCEPRNPAPPVTITRVSRCIVNSPWRDQVPIASRSAARAASRKRKSTLLARALLVVVGALAGASVGLFLIGGRSARISRREHDTLYAMARYTMAFQSHIRLKSCSPLGCRQDALPLRSPEAETAAVILPRTSDAETLWTARSRQSQVIKT